MQGVLVTWVARGLALSLSLFLGLFALDELQPGKSPGRTVLDVAIHLGPSAVVLLLLALSWRRQWIGALAFIALAAAYAAMVSFRIDWVLAISGPLLTVGLLYLWSWQTSRSHPAR